MQKYLFTVITMAITISKIQASPTMESGIYGKVYTGASKASKFKASLYGQKMSNYSNYVKNDAFASLNGGGLGFRQVCDDGNFTAIEVTFDKDTTRAEKRASISTIEGGNGATVPSGQTATLLTPSPGYVLPARTDLYLTGGTVFTGGNPILSSQSRVINAGTTFNDNLSLTYSSANIETSTINAGGIFPNNGSRLVGGAGPLFSNDLAANGLLTPADYQLTGTNGVFLINTGAPLPNATIDAGSTVALTSVDRLEIPLTDLAQANFANNYGFVTVGTVSGAPLEVTNDPTDTTHGLILLSGSKIPNLTFKSGAIIPAGVRARLIPGGRNNNGGGTNRIDYIASIRRSYSINILVQKGKKYLNGFAPYVTAGFTLTNLNARIISFDTYTQNSSLSKKRFNRYGIAAGLGTHYVLDPTKTINIQYLYQFYKQGTFLTDTVKLKTPKAYHNITLGLTWKF